MYVLKNFAPIWYFFDSWKFITICYYSANSLIVTFSTIYTQKRNLEKKFPAK